MKQDSIKLSRRYVAALGRFLEQGARAGLQLALRVGHQAVMLKLETLELARIHERSLVALNIVNNKHGLLKRAEIFFTEALIPIVETHRAARQSRIDLSRLNKILGRRTGELVATQRQLQRGISQRKGVEAALKVSGIHYAKLLKESLQIQETLRELTHQVLAAQEAERRKISCELQDNVAQTLLGINVRLLTLKQEARNNAAGLKNQIAKTRQLVVKSAKSVRRVARKYAKT